MIILQHDLLNLIPELVLVSVNELHPASLAVDDDGVDPEPGLLLHIVPGEVSDPHHPHVIILLGPLVVTLILILPHLLLVLVALHPHVLLAQDPEHTVQLWSDNHMHCLLTKTLLSLLVYQMWAIFLFEKNFKNLTKIRGNHRLTQGEKFKYMIAGSFAGF